MYNLHISLNLNLLLNINQHLPNSLSFLLCHSISLSLCHSHNLYLFIYLFIHLSVMVGYEIYISLMLKVKSSIYFGVALSSGVSLCSGMSWAIWAPNTHTHWNNTNLKLRPHIAQDNLCARVSYTYFKEEYLLGDFTKNIMINSTEIHEIH